jgi:hypothetical protein
MGLVTIFRRDAPVPDDLLGPLLGEHDIADLHLVSELITGESGLKRIALAASMLPDRFVHCIQAVVPREAPGTPGRASAKALPALREEGIRDRKRLREKALDTAADVRGQDRRDRVVRAKVVFMIPPFRPWERMGSVAVHQELDTYA